MKPYQVLGVYHPPFWKAWKVGEDLTAMTKSLGLVPLNDPHHGPQTWTPWFSIKYHAEVHKWHPGTHVAEDFHQDGDIWPGSLMDHSLVVWAQYTPTEFRANNKIYQPKPFEVVIARNLGCFHRRPANAPEERFFFHQCVKNPTHIELS